jgi:hypothetical protein
MNSEHLRSPLRAEALPAGDFMLFSETPTSNPAFTPSRLLQCSAKGPGARAPFFMHTNPIVFSHTHEIHSQGGETLSIIR